MLPVDEVACGPLGAVLVVVPRVEHERHLRGIMHWDECWTIASDRWD